MKLKLTRKIYLVILLVVWLGLSFQILSQFYFQKAGKQTYISLETGLIELPDEVEWMNILMNGKKVGYSYSGIRAVENNEYLLYSFLDFNTVIVGEQVKITTRSHATVDSNFHYRTFDWQIKSGIYNTLILGDIEDNIAKIKMVESGDTNRFEVALPIEIFPSQAIKYLLSQRGIAEGDKYVIPVFEPLSQEITDLVITHEGKREIMLDSSLVELNKIQVNYGNFPTFMWMDDNGISFREEGMLGLVLERTNVDDAIKSDFNISDFDIADFYAVPVVGSIPNPRQSSLVTLDIEGMPAQFHSQGDGESTEKLRLTLTNNTQPRSETDITPFLEANSIIQCYDPVVAGKAREITNGISDPLEKTMLLVDWVFSELEKVPVANLASASEILKQKVGDCSEHTTLYTSLSRSLGIPTKINMGLVYLNGRFLYHAWPSVLIDDVWIAVDPTFGQVPADATHLAIIEGDFTNMSQLLPILGQIKIFIIESES